MSSGGQHGTCPIMLYRKTWTFYHILHVLCWWNLFILDCYGSTPLKFQIQEGLPVGHIVGTVSSGDSLPHQYEIYGGSNPYFTLDLTSGVLKTASVIDREQLAELSIKLLVIIDGGTNGYMQVSVDIIDINDNIPSFPQVHVSLEISESIGINQKRSLQPATDPDIGQNSTQEYKIVSGNEYHYFRLQYNIASVDTLLLVVNKALDRETEPLISLNITCCDGGSPSLCGYFILNITLIDVNDNSPIFTPQNYRADINESAIAGTSVIKVIAEDADAGDNAAVTYYIDRRPGSDINRYFSIDTNTGLIITNGGLDHEIQSSHNIIVLAKDGGVPQRTGRGYVTITVLDRNDNAPKIDVVYLVTGSYQTMENSAKNSQIARISVTDKDTGNNGKLDLTILSGGDYFVLRTETNTTYFLEVSKSIDREIVPQLKVVISAKDNGKPQLQTNRELIINIGDENDNAPLFVGMPGSVVVHENIPDGTPLLVVNSTDADVGVNNLVRYSITTIPLAAKLWFTINPISGLIKSNSGIDRETLDFVILQITAKDMGSPSLSNSINLNITILDDNDHKPVFANTSFVAKIYESAKIGTEIGRVHATDADDPILFGDIKYSLSYSGVFEIDALTGVIKTSNLLDRETKDVYSFEIIATDGGGIKAEILALVSILDVDDNLPKFDKRLYNFTIPENLPVGAVVGVVYAIDIDIGVNAAKQYSIISQDDPDQFVLNPTTGSIELRQQLDRSKNAFYKLTVGVQGIRSNPLDKDITQVTITVLEANLNPPYFKSSSYNLTSKENQTAPYVIGIISAERDNFGIDKHLVYFIQFITPSGIQLRVNTSGAILCDSIIDYEIIKSISFLLKAEDKSDKSLAANTTVHVNVQDINDNSPQFSVNKLTIRINEGLPLGNVISTVKAIDFDSGRNGDIIYSITNSNTPFLIDPISAEILTNNTIDYEEKTSYNFNVIAIDNGIPSLQSTLIVNVIIQDVNDNAPRFKHKEFYADVSEYVDVGYFIMNISVTDRDSQQNGMVLLEVEESLHSDYFELTSNGILTVKKKLDRETISEFAFQISARDNGIPQLISKATIYVFVIDENDNSPVFDNGDGKYVFSLFEEKLSGSTVGVVSASDADTGSNGFVTYRLRDDSEQFHVNSMTGLITTKTVLDRETMSTLYRLIIIAFDGGEVSKTASASITINLIDTNDNMPVFSQDVPYMKSIIEDNVVGEHILTASASDADFALSGQVRYSLIGMNTKENESLSHFKIDPISGLLTLRTKVFYNQDYVYKFSVKAADLGIPSLLSFHKIFIYVLPKSDKLQIFDKRSMDIMINENDSVGSSIATIQVMRSQMALGKAWEYKIKSGNIGNSFDLNAATGVLDIKSPLTYAGLQTYQLIIVATDKASNSEGQIYINIIVLDTNENWPLFLVNPIVGVIYENLPIGSPLSTIVNATDKDQSTDVSVYYSIISQSPGLPSFSIEPFTGVIRTIKPIDREAVPEWSLIIMAKDLACNQSKQLNSTSTMRLVILDLNDNPPIFQSKNYTYMMEDEPPGYPVVTVIATDADQSENAKISYKIIAGNDEAKFEINMISGEITLTEPLIHNSKKSYYLTIKATDGGLSPLWSTTNIHIDIIDVNNDRPKFTNSKYIASISENLPIGSYVLKVKATDLDTGLNGLITYSMEDNDAVEINATSGVITTKMSLDREVRNEYILSVSAQDNSYPFRSDFASIRIKVDDVNDCKPEFLSGPNVTISVLENQKELSGIHTFTASDDDIGVNANVIYILQSTFGSLFQLNNITGSLSVTDVLDRESKQMYTMKVIARNSEAPYAEAYQDIIINILDVNDNYPEFDSHEYKRTIPEDTPLNTTILTLHATDNDFGINGAVRYSLPKHKNGNGTLLGKFDIDPITGNIYTIARLDYESQKVYYFLVQASDQALHDTREKSATVTITITDVNDNAPVFDRAVYTATVETAKPRDVILTVAATDKDSGIFGNVEYDLTLPNPDFKINRINGELSVKRDLSPANYRLTAVAKDQGITQILYSEVIIIVTVGQSFLHTPQFLNASLTFELPENSVSGTILGKVAATTSPESTVEYRLSNTNTSKVPFVVDTKTGVISVSRSDPLDYEQTHLFLFGVVAYVKGNETLNNYISGQVNLIDVNDNTPVITPSKLSVQLAETTRGDPSSINMYIAQFTVSDADRGNNSHIHFSIVSGNERDHFSIFKEDGILISKNGLDYELQKSYTLLIEARDNGIPSRASYSVVKISVTDKNDNAPVLSKYGPLPISEVTRRGTVLLIVHAYDLDETGVIRYSLLQQDGIKSMFSIDPEKGSITLLHSLDYETKKQFILNVEANDGVFTSKTTITINVVDANDNVPEFDQPGYYFYLPELLSRNYLIGRVNATDRDSGLYGSVRYSLSPSVADAFVIDQSTGQIYATKSIVLDPGARPLQLIVTASDSGTPSRVSSTTVRLRVNDPSYNGPQFALPSYSSTIPEDAKIGASVGSVIATSTIPDMYILYNIKSGNEKGRFNIDARSGIVHVNASLDREIDHQYYLVIAAQDREAKPRAATVYLNVTVTDANDHIPVFGMKRYTVKVYENITIGTSLLRVKATDVDDPATPNGRVTYSIQSGNSNSWFRINKTSGDINVVLPLDRETLAVHRLSVKASDGGVPARSSAVSVSIHLLDVNDNRPVFSLDAPQIHSLRVDENVVNNSVVFKAVARDEDASRNGMISYSIIGGDGTYTFHIDHDTGWVYSRHPIDFEKKHLYTLLVEAADFGVPSLKASFEYRIAVNDLNEFTPYFPNKTFELSIAGNAPIGKDVGLVRAIDEDGGESGVIFYSFDNPPDEFFKIEQLTGIIVVNRDIRKNALNRVRRSTEEVSGQMSYTVVANNGPNTAGHTMALTIAVDYTCPGCIVPKSLIDDSGGELKGWSLILVSIICVIAAVILLAFLIFIFTMRRRKKRAAYETDRNAVHIDQLYDHADNSNPQDHKLAPIAFRDLLRTGYDDPSMYQNASTLTSSGCPSYDSRLRNGIASSGCPGQSILDNKSTHSFDMYQAKPALDSGIQQDLDHHISDMTITETLTSLDSRPSRKSNSIKRTSGKAFLMESHESLYAFEEEGGGEAGGGMDVANLLYAKLADVDADEQDAIMDGTRPFQEEGALSHGGSLSTIVGSQEELRGGSYNWDSMLNWKPQFKPLKAMFSELAQIKTTAPTLTNDNLTISNRKMPDVSARIPLLSSFEQIGHGTQRSIDSNRTSLLSSVSSLPRSPISIQSNYTSAAMSPSFTPAITPMVNRSPSVSPLGSPERMISPCSSNTNSILDIAAGKDRKQRIDSDQTNYGEVQV